jgi:hypothetical protein
MKLLAWLDTASSNAFAREIAEEFTRNFQVGAGPASGKGTEQRLQHAIEVLGNRAAKFDRQSPLGWYRKARFMSTISDCLREKGHDEQLVDRAVYDVVMRMARRGT